MAGFTRISVSSPAQRDIELEPTSRAALIMEHVERLAAQAIVSGKMPASSANFVRQVIASRAARRQYFDNDLFADPAWDILLELYALASEQRRTSVSKLCMAAAVPTTTALRWIDRLHQDKLIERKPDPLDGRRVWVSLSDRGYETMTAYLESLPRYGIPI